MLSECFDSYQVRSLGNGLDNTLYAFYLNDLKKRHIYKTGPNGRYSGEELSKNASPCVGMDKNGVTALINSALAAKPYSYCESYCIDVMLHPSAVSGDEGMEIMKSLLFTYMKHGGMCMQFNIFDVNTLKDAQKHPEKYQNLQVRVCGWNVLWNNLSEKEQNAYITRAENIK